MSWLGISGWILVFDLLFFLGGCVVWEFCGDRVKKIIGG